MEDYFKQMTELNAGDELPAESGRAFFAQLTHSERKELLEKWLGEQNYELIVAVAYCGHINARSSASNTGTDYISRKGGKVNIDSRYFELFTLLADGCGIGDESLLPFYFACAKASKRSPLRVWQTSSLRQIRYLAADSAYSDAVRSFIKENDRDFVLAPLSVEVFGEPALKEYIELAVFGKGINKVALRNFLRGYGSEVLAFVASSYSELKTAQRVTAVRLLLSLKNSDEVGAFLRSVAETETSKSVLKLLSAPETTKARDGDDFEGRKAKAYFYDLMVSGKQVAVGVFLEHLAKPEFAAVADRLFFSLYEGDALTQLFVTDKGVILDLDNRAIKLPSDGFVKVTHPVEIGGANEHIRRWDIDQPFLQIRRKTYSPSEVDVRTASYGGIAGTTVSVKKFAANMRRVGFRALNYSRNGVFDCVGKKRRGIWCVLFITPVDTTRAKEGSVQAQCVRFYGNGAVIRLGRNIFVDDVTPLPLGEIDARAFSEFIYSVYDLMGCE